MKNGTAVADSNALEAAPKTKFGIQPFGKWVLIRKVIREQAKNEAGIILPGGGRSSRGEVLAVGNEAQHIHVGDLVVFTNYPIELEDIEELTGDDELKLVRAEEVYARAVPCS